MARLNTATGLWEDDEDGPAPPQAGAVGAQQAIAPAPPAVPAYRAPSAPAPVTPPPNTGQMSGVPPAQALPQVDPYRPQSLPPIPTSRVVSPAESANLQAQQSNMQARTQTAQDAGAVAGQKATAELQARNREDYINRGVEADRQRILDEGHQRIQDREAKAMADWDAYRQMGIKDPQAEQSFGRRLLAAIAIGLGQYASRMGGGGPNRAAELIKQANDQNIALQRANIEKAYQQALQDGKDVETARAKLNEDLRQLALKGSSLIDASKDRLKSELARMGVPEAQINANATVQQLEAESLAGREGVLTSIRQDEGRLVRQEIRTSRKGSGGEGGGQGLEAEAKVRDYMVQNPGDSAGAARLAASLGVPAKRLDKILQDKPTEAQTKGAQQGAVALRAIDEIERGGYTPSKAVIQKWIDNQREVERAQKLADRGVLGMVGASIGQRTGLLAQQETQGIPEAAAGYFANVRRYMETIGRKQSGAAISPTEWTNFFNQYGPNSKGGLQAARKYAEDEFKLSGQAGRQLEASGAVPTARPAAGGAQPSRQQRAKAIVNDPSKRGLYSTEEWAALVRASRGQ